MTERVIDERGREKQTVSEYFTSKIPNLASLFQRCVLLFKVNQSFANVVHSIPMNQPWRSYNSTKKKRKKRSKSRFLVYSGKRSILALTRPGQAKGLPITKPILTSYEQEELSLLYVSSETLTTNLYFEVQNLFLLWTLRGRPSRWTNDMFHLPKPPSWHFHIGSLDSVHIFPGDRACVRLTMYKWNYISFPPRPNSDIDWLHRAWFVKLDQGVRAVANSGTCTWNLESNIFSECCDYAYKIRENHPDQHHRTQYLHIPLVTTHCIIYLFIPF